MVTHAHAEPSTAELLRTALEEARELAKIELTLAKNDAQGEWRQARFAAIAVAVAAQAASVGLAMALFALALATGAAVAVSVIAGLLLLAVAGVALSVAYRRMPMSFLGRTRERIEVDVRELGRIGERSRAS